MCSNGLAGVQDENVWCVVDTTTHPCCLFFSIPCLIEALKYVAGCRVLDSIRSGVGIAAIAAVWSHEEFFARA